MANKILIIGSLNMDVVTSVERIPEVGETVLGKNLFYNPGGKGANQAAAAGKLGSGAVMLGSVGQDGFGEEQIKQLSAFGVDVSNVRKSEKQPTGTAVIHVDENGGNNIVVIQGANNETDIAYLKEMDQVIADCFCILLQMEIPYDAIYYAVRRAKELGKLVILNPAPAPETEAIPDEILACIDYLTPNETELLLISQETGTDQETIQRGAQKLLQKGVKNVVVTMGDQGSLLANNEKTVLYPTRKVRAVDSTAAGDCFNGAFAAGLAEGMNEAEAIHFASAAASISVTRKGAQTSIPTRAETDEILAKW